MSTYDFSTLYTTLPHNLIKDKLIDLIERTFQREGSPYLACNEGVDRGGGGTGIRWAESWVEGAESGVEGAESGVEGRGAGVEGAGNLERLGWEIDFLNRKFRENGSFRPIS